MLQRKTLFIIGAGAGFDIKMPMGEKLARIIADDVNIRFEDFSKRSGNDRIIEALQLLARQTNPRTDVNLYFQAGRQIFEGLVGWSSSIDGYLNRHQDQPLLQQVGKLAIAKVILESENGCDMYVGEPYSLNGFRNPEQVRASWFQKLWSILEVGIIKSKNLESIFDNLHVITFNYDRTLEHFLFCGLQQAYHLPQQEAAAIINAKLAIDHVYGQVEYLPWQDKGHGFAFGRKPDARDLVHLWKRITTFNEEIADKELLDRLAKKVAAAEQIIFLGCHFHQQNMQLLHAAQRAKPGDVGIYATAFGRSASAVQQIREQIGEMLNPRSGGKHYHPIDTHWGCKELFSEFDTTWSR